MSFHQKSIEDNPETIELHLYKQITIYGPYYPQSHKVRLYNLRNCLRKRGFKNTYLVENYQDHHFPFEIPDDMDSRNLMRSRYCLENSDLNILVFTFNSEGTGVGTEFDYCLDNNLDFLVFFEYKKKRRKEIRAASSLIRGRLKEIGKEEFNEFPEGDDDYLCTEVYSRVVDFFI